MENMEEITIENGVETVYEEPFYGCTSLKNVMTPHSVCVIHPLGFEQDSHITIQVWRDTPEEDQAIIDGLKISYVDEIRREQAAMAGSVTGGRER